MSFDIRNYIEQLEIAKETNTQWKCICPICKENNLTISKNNGAYKCFSNYCDNKLIRNHLSPSNTIFKKDCIFVQPKQELILDIPLKIPYTIAEIKSNNNYCYKEDNKVVYVYDKYHKVEKVIDKNGKKSLFPKFFDKDKREWYYGIDNPFLPYKPFDRIISGNTLIIVEGEKCAFKLSEKNIGSVSFRSYNQNDIISNILYLSKYFGIEKYLVLTDNDVTGISKAKMTKQYINKILKECSIIEIFYLYNMFGMECKEGNDIFDLLELKDFDIKGVLESWIYQE